MVWSIKAFKKKKKGKKNVSVPGTFTMSLPGSQKTCYYNYKQLASSPPQGKSVHCSDEQNTGGNHSKAKENRKKKAFLN